jgi:hypothetical protein
MINFSQLAIRGFISVVFGAILTVVISYVATLNLGIFWFLLILLWLIIAGVNGYLSKSNIEPFVNSIFVLIFWSVTILFVSLLLFNFANNFLYALHFSSELIESSNVIRVAFLTSIITSSILLAVFNFGAYGVYIFRKYLKQASSKPVEEIEKETYDSFEMPSDVGSYKQRTDTYDD